MTRLPAVLRRTLAPSRRLRVTPEGRWFLLLTVGVGVAAMNTGNNLLYLALSMNLSLVVISGLLSEWCLRAVSVEVRRASELFAARDSLLAVSCSFPAKRLPLPALSVAIPIGGERITVRFPDIPASGTATRLVRVRPARRGLLPPLSCSVSTVFPFSLFEKSADLTSGPALLVYPEPAPREEGGAAFGADGSIGGRAAAGPQGAAIRGVRDLAPGDPVRDIHWKASAKRGTWMFKEREKEPPAEAEIRLPDPSTPDAFERAVSRACALVLRWEGEGRPYRILHGDRPVAAPSGPGRRERALAYLALATPGGGPESGPGARESQP